MICKYFLLFSGWLNFLSFLLILSASLSQQISGSLSYPFYRKYLCQSVRVVVNGPTIMPGHLIPSTMFCPWYHCLNNINWHFGDNENKESSTVLFFFFLNWSLVMSPLFYHFDSDPKSLKWNLKRKIFMSILRRQDFIKCLKMKTSCLFDKYYSSL